MKKLLYLIPLALVLLNATPYALYKDNVGLAGQPPVPNRLAPANWTLLSFNINATLSAPLSISATAASLQTTNLNPSTSPPLSIKAKYKGFPFGAYFSNNISSTTKLSSASSQVSAWSWLWTTVDVLIVLLAYLIAAKLNRPRLPQAAESRSTIDRSAYTPPAQSIATPDLRTSDTQVPKST